MAARSLNKVLLIGNLTRDPEMRYTNSGTPVVTFGMATNKSWKDSEGDTKELAEFHNLVAWNKIAEICQQLLAKGMKVYIEGSLNTRSWEGEDGVTRYKTEIRVDNMILLDSRGKDGVGLDDTEMPEGKKKESEEEEPEREEPEDESQGEDPLEDDLPF
ncbi:MAG: single-stranded DNA-binding protein [Candidatus Dojkabacteria bacterium]|jgi:single-strand DNA-binding protein